MGAGCRPIPGGFPNMERSIEQRTMRKVYLRLLPFAVIVYFFCYLDRINIGFAALTMNKAIGLTAAAYGLSAGAFYLGYCIFEVPEQHHPGQGRRAAVDRADHDHLGARLRRHRASLSVPTASFPSASCSARPRPACSPASCCCSPTGSPTITAPASFPGSPSRCRFPSRSARRSPPPFSPWTACWVSPAGNGSICWKQCRPS